MRTAVYYKQTKQGIFKISTALKPGYKEHFAVWKDITAGLWSLVTDKDSYIPTNPTILEERIWRLLLRSSSLFEYYKDPLHSSEGYLTEEAFSYLMNFYPGKIPSSLVHQAILSVQISPEEEDEIKRQCFLLWSGTRSALYDAHPLLEEAIRMMNLKETYGIPTYGRAADIPQKLSLVMRLVAGIHSDIMDMNMKGQIFRERAMQQAGLTQMP